MLIKYSFKIMIILISLTFFLLFKNIAKKLETDLSKLQYRIDVIENQIKKKEDFKIELQVNLKPLDKDYNNKSILIENYLNKKMTIVRVNYDQKSD